MATDGRPVYVDEALFGEDVIVETTRDVRSVGEMLFDVDYLARQLLMDVEGDDSAQLLRGWPQVVSAAADAWRALPVRRGPQPRGPAEHMDRLSGYADGIETSLRTGWPGTGASDPRMSEIAQTLTRAARLVERYADEIPLVERPAVGEDVEAARTRIMHGLYVATHAVNVALHQHGRDRYHDARKALRPISLSQVQTPYAVAPIGQWVQRMTVAEKVAGDYVNGRFARSLAGEATRPPEDPGRLQRALTRWDIQAHRTLASDPTPGNILLATRTQVLVTGAASVLIDAAARADLLRSPTTTDRLLPAIDSAGRTWTNLANRWTDLTGPGTRVDGDLARASAEVRAACRQLTHDKTTLASVESIVSQPGLDRAATALLHALEAGSDLAHVVAEHADRADLTGPARALSRRAHNDAEAGLAVANQSAGDIVWVSPADILAKRHIPLPPPVAAGLRTASAAVIDACATSASAALTASSAPPPSAPVERGGARDVGSTTTSRADATKAESTMLCHRNWGSTPRGR